MTKTLRNSLLACTALCVALGLSVSSANASTSEKDIVRTAQIRLADLGYYTGPSDGINGRMTSASLMEFQRMHGLNPSGELTQATYNLLEIDAAKGTALYNEHNAPRLYRTAYAPQTVTYDRPAFDNNGPVTAISWNDRWHSMRDQELPMRFARLNVHEEDNGTIRHYAVTLNGHAVLFADNQPGVLRVSDTYSLNGQDVVIFTAYQASGECPNRSYLLSVYSDGSFTNPREIGNCAGSFEAHVADNSLIIRFPNYNIATGWETWDAWRYEDERVARL